MTLTMNLQNLQQKSIMSFMIKIVWIIVKKIKTVQALNLRQKLLIQFFAIIFIFKSDAYVLVKGDTLATVGIAKTSVALKKCTSITNYATHIIVNIMMMLKILTLQCLCTIWLNIVIIIQVHVEAYGILKEMNHL